MDQVQTWAYQDPLVVYHFAPDAVLGPACSAIVQRIDASELTGFTSTHILPEMAHRMMAIATSRPKLLDGHCETR